MPLTLAQMLALVNDNTAGEISAADVRDVVTALFNTPTVVRKAATESVTSSIALQNDDELLFAVGTSEIWVAHGFLFVDGATTGDITVGFAGPAGASGQVGIVGSQTNSTTFNATTMVNDASVGLAAGIPAGTVGAGNISFVIVAGTFTSAGTAGNINLQWAQRVSDATATRVLAGSFLIASRIS